MPVDRDLVGTRGEQIAMLALTSFFDLPDPLFRPVFMGDKYPAIDLFVELINPPGDLSPFFVAQVKTTSLGYTSSGKRIKAKVSPSGLRGLISYPVPSYIIGVDQQPEQFFISCARSSGKVRISESIGDHQAVSSSDFTWRLRFKGRQLNS